MILILKFCVGWTPDFMEITNLMCHKSGLLFKHMPYNVEYNLLLLFIQ